MGKYFLDWLLILSGKKYRCYNLCLYYKTKQTFLKLLILFVIAKTVINIICLPLQSYIHLHWFQWKYNKNLCQNSFKSNAKKRKIKCKEIKKSEKEKHNTNPKIEEFLKKKIISEICKEPIENKVWANFFWRLKRMSDRNQKHCILNFLDQTWFSGTPKFTCWLKNFYFATSLSMC